MDSNSEATLLRGASELGVELSPGQLHALLDYAHMVRRWNDKFNLVSRQDMDRFVSRHLLDSLSVARLLPSPNVLDLGSGAGLPGIPLALACPDRKFVVLDRGARKARFLRQVVQQLGLANVTVRCQDARDVAETFACVVSRAVASVSKLWTLAEPLLAAGGKLLVLHRTDRKGTRALAPVPEARLCSHWVRVPGLSEEHEILTLVRAES